MSDSTEIPAFLRRNPEKEIPMNTHAPSTPSPTPAGKKKRISCVTFRHAVSIPIDMEDTETLAKATKAIKAMLATLPDGTFIKETTKPTFDKMAAE